MRTEEVVEGARGYGALALALISLASLVALVAVFALSTRGTSSSPKFIPEEGPTLAYMTAAAGCLVVLASLALYIGLAVGAHREAKDNFAKMKVTTTSGCVRFISQTLLCTTLPELYYPHNPAIFTLTDGCGSLATPLLGLCISIGGRTGDAFRRVEAARCDRRVR